MLSEKYWLAVGGSEICFCGPGRIICVGIITRMNWGISEGLCDGQEAVMEVEPREGGKTTTILSNLCVSVLFKISLPT